MNEYKTLRLCDIQKNGMRTVSRHSATWGIRLTMLKKEGLEEGLIKGERNKAMEIATKMKAKGFSVDDIVLMTGLSADEVKKIKH